MSWFYISTNKERVPFTEQDVGVLVHGGTLRPESMVWREGMKDWLSASEVRPEWFSTPRGRGAAEGAVVRSAGEELEFVRSAAAVLLGSGGAFVAAVTALVLGFVLAPIPGVLFLVAAIKLGKARNRLARAEALGVKSAMTEGLALIRQALGWAATGAFFLVALLLLVWILSLVL